VILSRPKD